MSGVGSSTISGTPSSFLILPGLGDLRAEVGDGRGHHDHVGRGCELLDGGLHLGGGLDGDQHGAGRSRQLDGRHERDPGAAGECLGRDRVALLAAAAVGDDPHGVDRFAGAAGGHDDMDAAESATAEDPLDLGDDSLRCGQATLPESPPASRPSSGSTMCTPRRRSVAMLSATAGCSHISVCIAGQTIDRGARGEQDVGQQIGRQPGGVRADQAGRRRRDEDEVGRLAERGVRDRAVARPTGSVCTGSLASADSVVRPMKCSAPSVITGMTWAPASTSRRQISTAL